VYVDIDEANAEKVTEKNQKLRKYPLAWKPAPMFDIIGTC
jgi:hypothetical protein